MARATEGIVVTWMYVDPDELESLAREFRSLASSIESVARDVSGCCRCASGTRLDAIARDADAATRYAVRTAADALVFQASDLERRAADARESMYGALGMVGLGGHTAASSASGPGVATGRGISDPIDPLRALLYPSTTTIGGNSDPGWSVAAPRGTSIGASSSMTIGGRVDDGFSVVPTATSLAGSSIFEGGAVFGGNSWPNPISLISPGGSFVAVGESNTFDVDDMFSSASGNPAFGDPSMSTAFDRISVNSLITRPTGLRGQGPSLLENGLFPDLTPAPLLP